MKDVSSFKMQENKEFKPKMPLICVFLYVAILPLSYVNIGSFGSLYKLASLGLLALCALSLLRTNIITMTLNRVTVAWILYMLYCAISLIWTPSDVLYRTTGLITIGIITLIFTMKSFDEDQFKLMEIAWILASIVLIVLFFTRSQALTMSNEGRYTLYISGSIVDANEYASAFCVGVGISLTHFLDRKNHLVERVLFFLLFAIMLYVVLRTGSRGGLIATLVTVFFSAVNVLKSNKKAIIGVLLLCIAAYFSYSYLLSSILPGSVLARLSLASAIESRGTHRFEIWSNNYQIYSQGNLFRILFGYGLSGLPGSVCHNNFLQNLFGLGIIGFLLYLNMIFAMFIELKKPLKRMYFGPYVALIVASLALTIWSSNKMWWTFFLIPLMRVPSMDYSKSDI